jgi:hypothetical protein
MLRIEASRTSMNWTRQSRIRIATPRLDDREVAFGDRGVDTAFGYVSADMAGVSFIGVCGGDTPEAADVTCRPERTVAQHEPEMNLRRWREGV